MPFVAPLARSAATALEPGAIPSLIDEAFRAAGGPPSGPAFVDFPLDVVFSEATPPEGPPSPAGGVPSASADLVDRAVAALREAERPVIMAGTGLYWGAWRGRAAALAEELGIPVFLNGLGRGCLPADHELFFSRARGAALSGADVALVIGVPLDFRLGFGAVFGPEARVIVIDAAEPDRPHPREVLAELYGDLPGSLEGLRAEAGTSRSEAGSAAAESARGPSRSAPGPSRAESGRDEWIASLREIERQKRAAEADRAGRLASPASPDADLRRAGPAPGPRRDRRRRRRRLRLVCGDG